VWVDRVRRLAQELPQHAAEAVHRADRQPIGRPGQRRQGMIGAEEVARSVDQIDAVAARDRFPGGESFALSDGHDARNIGIARPRVS